MHKNKDISVMKQALLEKILKQGYAKEVKQPQIPRRKTKDPAPLSFSQQRLWILDQLKSR